MPTGARGRKATQFKKGWSPYRWRAQREEQSNSCEQTGATQFVRLTAAEAKDVTHLTDQNLPYTLRPTPARKQRYCDDNATVDENLIVNASKMLELHIHIHIHG
jgi:hypothetical protein